MTDNTATQKLQILVKRYLADDKAQAMVQAIVQQRKAALPQIQAILQTFIRGESSLESMRNELDTYLRQHNYWGSTGFWQMSLNQFTNHYGQEGEDFLRTILDGLDQNNYPQRLEQLAAYIWVTNQNLKVHGSSSVAPGRAAFFLGLFTLWLNSDSDFIMPWPSARKGLKELHRFQALPSYQDLNITTQDVHVSNAREYNAFQQAIISITQTAPQLASNSEYEQFCSWVYQHRAQIPIWLDHKEIVVSFPDEPLKAIEPSILKERIAQLQQSLLINEDAILRIYQALVLGRHIILSGPPGTGKTQLAQKLPEILWQTSKPVGVTPTFHTPNNSRITAELSTETSYTVRIETATDEWTPRHVIGGLAPVLDSTSNEIQYQIAAGCLTQTIFDNWQIDETAPDTWQSLQRVTYVRNINKQQQEYRGIWLVIDEFNRAPIDLALGEALTAISGGQNTLTVPTNIGPQALPIPSDFRIIGTLNTFDRHFLNQMSEALKRRFAFIEILPPERKDRKAEQAMVIHQTLQSLPKVSWANPLSTIVSTQAGNNSPWEANWDTSSAVYQLFIEGWNFFEVIRIYRQFGTAQAIAWCSAFLGSGLLQGLDPNDSDRWRHCLSTALADTLADQLQILFPDEIEVLLAYLRSTNSNDFAQHYNALLARQTSPKRRSAQMLALQSVRNDQGQAIINADYAQQIIQDEQASIATQLLEQLFHSDSQRNLLPDLIDRLERFLFERTI